MRCTWWPLHLSRAEVVLLVVGLDVRLLYECLTESEQRAVCGSLSREMRGTVRNQRIVCGEIKGSVRKCDGERGATVVEEPSLEVIGGVCARRSV
jgi:hypothetical protein